MIRAAIDPGSRWIAVAITRDDGPASPCVYLDARCFVVPKIDHLATYDPPQVRIKMRRTIDDVLVEGPLEAYEVHEERLQSPEEKLATEAARRGVGDDVGAYLVAHGVEAVDVETVEYIFGDTPQARAAATKAIRDGDKITERALTIWDLQRTARGLPSPRVPILAVSWRARLNVLVKASAKAAGVPVEGVLIRGKGTALEPVLVAHVPGWPGGATWTAEEVPHIRDAMGLALASGMPATPKRAASLGVPRVRVHRPRGPRTPDSPATRKKRARQQCVRDKRARDEARVASGCTCRAVVDGVRRGGRCARACPAFVAKYPATS